MSDTMAAAHGRLRIVCRTDDEPEVELPLRMLFVGDYMGRDERPIDERVPVRIDKDNFAEVLAAQRPRLDVVAVTAGGRSLRASLTFSALSDFEPESLARRIPEVAQRLALRGALTDLKNTGDAAAFRAQLGALIADAPTRAAWLAALGLGDA